MTIPLQRLAIEGIFKDDLRRFRMNENAAGDAKEWFNQPRQPDQYLRWYEEILVKNTRDQKAASVGS